QPIPRPGPALRDSQGCVPGNNVHLPFCALPSRCMSDRAPLTPSTFDRVFREAAHSDWTKRVIGADLPPEVDPFSFITLDGLHQIARTLAPCRGETLVDLACGRGGPGLWLARQIGAALVGIDFSPVGIDHARARATEYTPELSVRYIVADAAATGLSQEGASGLVCIDAIQLMSHREAVMAETCRLLRPGARAVFTTWEEPDRLRDLAALFESAGLITVAIEARPDWLDRERSIFERALSDAPQFPEDESLLSLAAEALEVLPRMGDCRRVLGIAEKPPRGEP
ncbi:MAG TPA: class I SAM-dependent methyltransferase, partial [Acidimicrobiia bacterium]|nr:class I SAM-dependent methyltransferase [Acidimicrobiia bacterium]